MSKIIVGFDATDQGKDALRLGATLARAEDAELIVASAIEFLPLEVTAAAPYDYNEARARHYEHVFELARAELGDTAFERRELQDAAAHGLTELAEQEGADMIVIGSTHHGPIGRVLAGTVAARLFQGAPCEVLVAPRGWSAREHPGIGLIGVGYDGSEESAHAIARAAQLAEEFDATLRVITVAPHVGADAEFGPVAEQRPTWAEIVREGADGVSDRVETEPVLRQGRAPTELALQGVDLDLLVVGSRGYGPLRRTLTGSVSGELVRTAPCPVVVVPRTATSRDGAESGLSGMATHE
jgi:nucleotide-binding universal stress UspA family protein